MVRQGLHVTSLLELVSGGLPVSGRRTISNERDLLSSLNSTSTFSLPTIPSTLTSGTPSLQRDLRTDELLWFISTSYTFSFVKIGVTEVPRLDVRPLFSEFLSSTKSYLCVLVVRFDTL